jgi:hypothetical protein
MALVPVIADEVVQREGREEVFELQEGRSFRVTVSEKTPLRVAAVRRRAGAEGYGRG